jgi:hypothetical protein
MKKINLLAVLVAGVFAVACNGGGGGSPTPNPPPPIVGLTTSFSDGSSSFDATTDTPVVTKVMTLLNNGESNVSQIAFTLPSNGYFDVTHDDTGTSPCTIQNQSITNTLVQNQDCTIKVTYSNAIVTPSSSANIVFNYLYGLEEKIQTTSVSYMTTSIPTPPVPSDKVKYVAVGDSGSISYTLDGKSWIKVDNTNIKDNITAVTVGSAGFVAVGANYGYYSTDGKVWSKSVVSNNSNVSLNSIAYGNGYYVAVGSSSTAAYRSVDGKTWTKEDSGQNYTLNSIVFANGKFVTVGGDGLVCYAELASNWNCNYVPKVNMNRQTLNVIAFGSSGFMTIGKYGQVYTSDDAVLWVAKEALNDVFDIVNNEYKDLAYGNNSYVAYAEQYGPGYTLTFNGNPAEWQIHNLALVGLNKFSTLSFNGTEFIAIQNFDSHYGSMNWGAVLYTSQDGITFTAQSLIDKINPYNAIANAMN